MKELIKVTTNDKGQQLVSARELYEGLKYDITKGNFARWIEKQLESVDAIEGEDFSSLKTKTYEEGGRPSIDYILTIDIAKEICMVVGISPRANEETRKLSKQFRKYFIECEKIAKGETNVNKYISEVDIAKSEIELVDIISKTLNLNDVSKLQLMGNVLDNHNINKNLLPVYAESKGTLLSASELLKRNNINISVIKFNKVMIDKGYLVKKERPSTKDSSKIKKYNNLVKTEFGENFVSPKNPKETQPMYYENKFLELLKELEIC